MFSSALRKRKEREGPAGFRVPPEPATKPKFNTMPAAKPADNRLLAGYLAHEFLSGGTLFGKPFPPAADKVESSRPSSSAHPAQSKPSQKTEPQQGKAYADVAALLMGGGAHLPGVVNPTQVGQWMRM